MKITNRRENMTIYDDENGKKFTVLIVEDNYFCRTLHKVKALNLGLEPFLVEYEKEAVDLHRAGASFDLIIMDIFLPVMDGTEVPIHIF